MIKFLLLLSLIGIGNCGFGQRTFLMLQKQNKNKNVYYKVGDKISFRLNESRIKTTGEILELQDSVVVFKGFEVGIAEISSIYIDEKTRWWLRFKIEQLCLIAGGGYLLLDIINNGDLSENTLIISGTMIAAGIIAKVLIGNRVKIRSRTKLRIVKL